MPLHIDNNGNIKDINKKGNENTIRTWLYVLEEIETKEMIQLLINN